MYMNIPEWSEWTSANEITVLGILETKYWENFFFLKIKKDYLGGWYLSKTTESKAKFLFINPHLSIDTKSS